MSSIRRYHSIELAELYLEHCLTQLEHVSERILGVNTLENMRKTQYLEFLGFGLAGSGRRWYHPIELAVLYL